LKDIIYVTISMVGVLGLFFMLAYGLRRLSKRVSFTGGGRLRVLDRANLGKDAMLLVVSVCGKLMLIGVSGQSVQKLAELEMSEEDYTATVTNSGNAGFFDVFSGLLKKKENKQEENGDEDEGSS